VLESHEKHDVQNIGVAPVLGTIGDGQIAVYKSGLIGMVPTAQTPVARIQCLESDDAGQHGLRGMYSARINTCPAIAVS